VDDKAVTLTLLTHSALSDQRARACGVGTGNPANKPHIMNAIAIGSNRYRV